MNLFSERPVPTRVQNPLSKDHYTFLNAFLDKSSEQRITKDTKLDDTKRKQLISEIEESAQQFLLTQRFRYNEGPLRKMHEEKIAMVLDILRNDEKKKLYDQGLGATLPTVELKSGQSGYGILPLVPIEQITQAYTQFTKDLVGKERSDSGGKKYEPSDFSHEVRPGNPQIDIYTFPDKASADAFIKQLFEKNLAMLPGGSQNMQDVMPVPHLESNPLAPQSAAMPTPLSAALVDDLAKPTPSEGTVRTLTPPLVVGTSATLTLPSDTDRADSASPKLT